MWPFDRPSDVLRVGRRAVEFWRRSSSDWRCLAASQLIVDEQPSTEPLEAGLGNLFGRLSDKCGEASPPSKVAVVVESAWMPVIHMDLSGGHHSRRRLDLLADHHLRQLYGSASEDAWTVRCDHRPGARNAVAFGLSAQVQRTLQLAGSTHHFKLEGVQPALSWAWHQPVRGKRDPVAHWFVCLEQDRSIVCLVRGGHIVSINPGAAPVRGLEPLRRIVDLECARLGLLPTSETANVFDWGTQPPAAVRDCESLGLTWQSLSAAADTAARPYPRTETSAGLP